MAILRELDGLYFLAGFEIGYQVNGSGCSSPQTTELRVGGEEGGGAAESTLMKWVHMSSCKTLLATLLAGVIFGNFWAFAGGLVSVLDMEWSYWFAKRCGRRLAGQPVQSYAQKARGGGPRTAAAGGDAPGAAAETWSLRGVDPTAATSGGNAIRY